MDMLCRAYSSPMEIMRSWIRRGRFGEFVTGFLQAEQKRLERERDKDEDLMLWIAYVHSATDKSFSAWKSEILQKPKTRSTTGGDHDLTDEDIEQIIGHLFPGSTTEG